MRGFYEYPYTCHCGGDLRVCVGSGGSAGRAGEPALDPSRELQRAVSQPFAQYGDTNDYFLVPGGFFNSGEVPWALSAGARVESGSLSLPVGSSATSPVVCASIYDPTARLFAMNSGASSSRLRVEALYPALLGGVQAARIGELSGTSTWQPTPQLGLTVTNLLATLSLQQTAIAYRFTPEGSGGQWRIDDVYVDPRMR